MNKYSQHGEDHFIDKYGLINKDSVILDIGANDGITFSNSRFFIEKYGSSAFLVEPTSECISRLNKLYLDSNMVTIIPYAISEKNESIKINVGNLMDLPTCINQVSTLIDNERVYWEKGRNVVYTEETIQSITPTKLVKLLNNVTIDLLSIDTEGYDYFILSELYNLGIKPKFIIFEWNSKLDVLEKCLNLLLDNYEMVLKHPVNLIFKLK
jgi:FkbM family methyltransferase